MSRLAPALLLGLAMVAAGCSGQSDTVEDQNDGAETTTTDVTDEPADEETAEEDNAGDDETSDSSDLVLRMQGSEPQYLIPGKTTESSGSDVIRALFTPLVDIDADMNVLYGSDSDNSMAEDITANEDNTVYTIKLKEGWTFHNGEPVTAESFVNAWNWTVDPENAASTSYFFEQFKGYKEVQDGAATEMEGLKAVDDNTIEVTLTEPFSPFVSMLAYNAFYPMPEAAYDDMDAYNEAPIGNGPFMMDGVWKHKQEIKVTTYDDYMGNKPSYGGIDFILYESPGTAYNDMLANNLDIGSVPSANLPTAEAQFGEHFHEYPSSNYGYLGMPVNAPQVSDKRIRQALSMAIDRKTISDTIFDGILKPADDIVSPMVDGYREGACVYCEFNPEEAKKLYDEAGGIQGPLTVWFNAGGDHETWIEAVSNMWKQHLGVEEVEFQTLQWAEYLGKLDAGEVDGPFRMGWIADYPSMQNYLGPMISSTGSSNYTGYANPEFDEALAEGNRAPSAAEAVAAYQKAADIALEDMVQMPMTFGRAISVSSERVTDLEKNFFGWNYTKFELSE